MKKFLLFLTLACAAIAQVSIDIGDIAWPASSANQIFRRNAANNAYEFVTLSPVITLGTDATGSVTLTNLSSGTLNLTLVNSGVSAGTYGSASQPFTFVFDAKGRATSITANTQSANTIFAGPGSGSAAAPAFRALNQADTQAATAANRNALAPRVGISFDGNGGTVDRFFASSAGSTDPFSIVWVVEVPAGTAPMSYGGFWDYIPGDSMGASTKGTLLTFAGSALGADGGESNPNSTPASGSDLMIYMRSSGNSGALVLKNFRTTYAGKRTVIAVTRDASHVYRVYVNGALALTQTGSACNLSSHLQAHEGVGRFGRFPGDVSRVVGTLYSASLYNLALSAADAQEIYELGGAVPTNYKFGALVADAATNNADFATGSLTQSNTVVTNNQDAVSDGTTSLDNVLRIYADGTSNTHGAYSAYAGGLGGLGAGKWFRFKTRYYIPTGQTNVSRFRVARTGSATDAFFTEFDLTTAGTWTTASQDTQVSVGAPGNLRIVLTLKRTDGGVIFSGANSPTDDRIYIAYFQILPLGAVVHLAFGDQLGLQVRDASTNGFHANRTAAGTYWTDPRQSGRQSLTYTFAHSDISSTAATTTAFVLPPNTVLREIQLNRTAAFDASTTLDIGISGTPTKFVTATNVVPTGFAQVTSSSLVPESATANTTVYVKKNQATTTGSVTLNFIIEAVGSPTQP